MTLSPDPSMKSRWVRVVFSSITGTALTVLAIPYQTSAQQVYFDKECKATTYAVMQRGGAFRVDNTFQVETKKGNHVFYAARYGDGSGLFCIYKPGSKNAKKISVPFQMGFFNNVIQKNSKTIEIEIQDGNGFNIPVTLYQLKFKNPVKPKVKPIRTWIGNTR